MDEVKVVVVYDNYSLREDLQTAHGFACVVQAGGRAVLFDTGGSGQILLENMGKLGLDPTELEAVVLSHMHWDHIGGLDAVLAVNPDVCVCVPATFSSSYLRDLRARAGAVVKTEQSQHVADCIWTTDVFDRPLVEQAIYVETAEGIVVVTGCAHAGVAKLTRSAQRASGGAVHTVLGGFHMAGMGQTEIDQAIQGLKELGVQHVGPSHCSGDAARQAMRVAYGDDYVEVGAGALLGFPATGSG